MRELRPVDEAALKVLEGEVPYVYDDSKYPTRMYVRGTKVGGTLTAGVGHTGSDLDKWIGKEIPKSQIDKWLDADNDVAERFVNTKIKVPLNDNQFAALVFWVFNVGTYAGPNNTGTENTTLVKKLNAKDYDSVPAQLKRWNKTRVHGKMIESNGLIKRRADEIAYWLADTSVAPKPVPRPKDKPTGTQTAELEVPKTITLENAAAGAGILSTIFGAITNDVLAYAFAGIAVATFSIAAYWFVTKRLFPK